MSLDLSVEIVRRAVILSIMVASPLLVSSLVVGVLVSLLQAVTQIQEQTLSFIPKVLTIALVLLVALPWIMQKMVGNLTAAMNTLSTIAP